MTAPTVSIIVVSRGRSDALVRCLAGIEQLYAVGFELVVVADPAGLTALSSAGFDGRCKTVAFDEPNISTARNQGVAAAAGQVLAFIDDDAVPEPTWLTYLVAPFADETVQQAGGYVRARDGVSFQYKARRVDALGHHSPFDTTSDAPQLVQTQPGNALKTEGTNCAFRADTLRTLGGFDPALRFYLDETDVNLRFASKGATGAIVPQAEVHHHFAASDRRLPNRMPTSLFEIGASQAVFLRKHAPDGLDTGLRAFRLEQRTRLVRFMVAGLCDPRDVGRLMTDLERGIEDGRARRLTEHTPVTTSPAAFLPFSPRKSFDGHRIISGPMRHRKALRAHALESIKNGTRTSLFLFSGSSCKQHIAFTKEGIWEHSDGILGNAALNGWTLAWQSFENRAKREVQRVSRIRGASVKKE